MSFWLTDPELFLYAKGTGPDDVHLWRCKKPASSSSSSLVVPMKPDDFDYVSNVKNHLELIGDIFDWDEMDYKRLVKYIFERRLLVNSNGFVIAELNKVDKDGNKMIDDANKEVPAIYIRSLDVLALKPYIPKLRERPIPFRTVRVLEDVNGKAALMEEDSKVTKLTARVDNLEAENTRLTTRVADLEAENTRLKSKNDILDSNVKTLEGKVTKVTEDLVTQMNALATLQQEVKNAYKEFWMNDLTNTKWVGIEGLLIGGGNTYDHNDDLITVSKKGTYSTDDGETNVQARYWYNQKLRPNGDVYKVVCLDDLTPNKEKARFLSGHYWGYEVQGKMYVHRTGSIH